MAITATEIIKSSIEDVWKALTDIEGASQRISCIVDLKMIEKPAIGLVGTKWQETRVMFGKEAVETMWITKAEDFSFYETRAENCGSIYTSIVKISEVPEGIEVSMSFESKPLTIMAKLMTPIMWLFGGSIKKAFQKDLLDIKKSLED